MSEKKYIQSVQRSSMILEFLADKGAAKLNEICEGTGLKTSTAFGILQTLEYVGQVTRTNGGLDYTLGMNSLKLGLAYLNGSGINDKIHELLVRMVEVVNETTYFMLKVGDSYYYLDYIIAEHSLKVVPEDGLFIKFPENSAAEQVYMRHHEEGFKYALDLEGINEGMNCFAAPYRTGGELSGLLAITGPSFSGRFSEDKMEATYESYIAIMKELGLENHL